MKKRAFAGMTALFVFIPPLFAVPPKVDIPPLNYSPPKPERTVLKNGLVVVLLEDHELPLFDMNLVMAVSPADEPKDQPEALEFLGSVWRTGGTKEKSPEVLNEELEQMAASVETSAGTEYASVTLSCLSPDLDKSLGIFTDIFLTPVFWSAQLNLAKGKVLEGLRRKNDDIANIGRRAFRDIMYGKTHIYARNPTPQSVARVSRQTLMFLHKKILAPQTSMLMVAGDFKKNELLALLEKKFEAWKPTPRSVPNHDFSPQSPPGGKIFFVKKDVNQSRIVIGRLGGSRHNPDHFSLDVANTMLGGGGSSRLFAEIRSRLGLAYGVGSFFTEPKGPGLVGVAGQTKPSSTVAMIRALNKELDKFCEGPLDPEEINQAKQSLINSFIFRFNSKYGIVTEQGFLEFLGYPADYLGTYTDRIREVTSDKILKANRKYFSKEGMKILVVGDETKFDEPLEKYGDVTAIPLESIE